MNEIIINLLIFFISTTSCGFKVLDKSQNKIFLIQEIQISGDNRINYKIKNRFL